MLTRILAKWKLWKTAAIYQSFRCFNVILQGDALYACTRFQSQVADVIVTDPPYCILERRRKGGVLREPKLFSSSKTADESLRHLIPRFKDMTAYRDFTFSWLHPCIHHVLRKKSDRCSIIIWTNSLGKQVIISECAKLDYILRGEYVWAKTSDRNGAEGFGNASLSTKNEILLRVYESALIFQYQPATLPAMMPRELEQPYKLPWSVVTGYKSAEPLHPCHKPLVALLPLIHAWTRPGDVVLDPFCGSGGVLDAVLHAGQGRRVLGMEKDPFWAEHCKALVAARTSQGGE